MGCVPTSRGWSEGAVTSWWLQNILEGSVCGQERSGLHALRDPSLLGCGGDRVSGGTRSTGLPESEGSWEAGSQGPGRGRARPSRGCPRWSSGASPSRNVEQPSRAGTAPRSKETAGQSTSGSGSSGGMSGPSVSPEARPPWLCTGPQHGWAPGKGALLTLSGTCPPGRCLCGQQAGQNMSAALPESPRGR